MKDWQFGLQLKGVLSGLIKYGLPAVIATVAVTFAFCIGLMPFDNKPTIWRVVIEGIVYYIGVGIMEYYCKVVRGKKKRNLVCDFDYFCIIWLRSYFRSFGTADCNSNS